MNLDQFEGSLQFCLSENQDSTDVVPEKCTEKLVDLVFVLATKLDLNVNDMRELLENSMKENCQKFEELTNKLRVEVDNLSEKIKQLEAENRGQNERLTLLETEASQAGAKHEGLQSDVTDLRNDYNHLVIDDHGARLSSLEAGHQDLKENISQLNRENVEKFGEMILNLESMEGKLSDKIEESGHSLEVAWKKREEENNVMVAQSLTGVDARLEVDNRRLFELESRAEDSANKSREYQQNNDQKIEMMNNIMLRLESYYYLNIVKILLFAAIRKILKNYKKISQAAKRSLKT